MSKTSTKYILQIKSAFLRLNLIYTDIAGYILSHVQKCWWIQETAVGQTIAFLSVLSQACTWEILNQLHHCLRIYLFKSSFSVSQNTLSRFEKRNKRLGHLTNGKPFQFLLLSDLVFTSDQSENSKACRATFSPEWVITYRLFYP